MDPRVEALAQAVNLAEACTRAGAPETVEETVARARAFYAFLVEGSV